MNILGKSISELRYLLDKKDISEDELFNFFKKRISRFNPKLNAFLTIVDKSKSNHVGLLSGIPFAIKDNFCTQNIRTTASSKVLDNFIPPYESTVTKKLLNSGSIIIGKTNMDAWAHGSSTETSDYGVTKNPWDLTRVAGGSSGGSSAAVSSYITPAAIGSETAGSIRGPASWCGLVGLKPTYGRVSRYGLIAMGSSLDCPGPITLTVKDAALILQIIAGKDKFDATSSNNKIPNYLDSINQNKKLKIGVPEEYFYGLNEEIKISVMNSISKMKQMGHQLKKVKLLDPKYAISVYTIIQRSEVSSNLARYDGIRFGNNRSTFAAEAKRRIMFGTYTLSYGYYDAFYKKAQKVRTLIIEDFKNAFKDVDVIIGPTMPITATKIGDINKYPFFGELMDKLTEPAAEAGIPAINIPVGLDKQGLPIGASIMGRWFDEETILDLANQFEKETDFFGVIKKGINNYK